MAFHINMAFHTVWSIVSFDINILNLMLIIQERVIIIANKPTMKQ